jgi:hypothetical protein
MDSDEEQHAASLCAIPRASWPTLSQLSELELADVTQPGVAFATATVAA